MQWAHGFRLPLHLDHAVDHPLQLKEAIHGQLALPALQVRTAGILPRAGTSEQSRGGSSQSAEPSWLMLVIGQGKKWKIYSTPNLGFI